MQLVQFQDLRILSDDLRANGSVVEILDSILANPVEGILQWRVLIFGNITSADSGYSYITTNSLTSWLSWLAIQFALQNSNKPRNFGTGS